VYHRLSLAIAASYLLLNGSWFLGNKYDSPIWLCKTQEYVFQSGTLFNMAAMTAISFYIFYMIKEKALPPPKTLSPYVVFLFVYAVISIIASVSLDTASLFCYTDQGGKSRLVDGDASAPLYKRLGYWIAYIFPSAAMNAFNLFGFFFNIVYIFSHQHGVLMPLLRRLMANNFIIMMMYIPAAVIFFCTTEEKFLRIGSALVSSGGVFFSLAYFYFAVWVDEIMTFPAWCCVKEPISASYSWWTTTNGTGTTGLTSGASYSRLANGSNLDESLFDLKSTMSEDSAMM